MKPKWIFWGIGIVALLAVILTVAIQLKPYDYTIAKLQEGTDHYDVIVIGGEPEGVAAAVSAARNGAKTLLIEKRDGLGGLMTYGMLNYIDLGLDKDKKPANAGIFREWHKMVGGGISFDSEEGKNAFRKLVENEANLTLLLNSEVDSIKLSKNEQVIEGILVDTPKGKRVFTSYRFIDSTADADFAAKVGVPYFIGQQDIGLNNTKMSVTLMMHFKNVDWEQMKEVAKKETFGTASVGKNVAWGFWGVSEQYKPYFDNTRLRGLNIARQSDDSIYINALQIFGIDGLNDESKQQAIATGREETQHILDFLRKNFPGFENAEIASFPTELYVRETRHINAEYQLPISDVWENKDHWDSIAFGSYPVDMQATTPKGKDEIVINPKQYGIPFRSLVPNGKENLLVASRASGYSSLAAGSARIIPTGMSTAEAAGVASVVSINKGQYYSKMMKDKDSIHSVQNQLKARGGHLYSFEGLDYPYKGEWFYPSVKVLYSKGLIYAGYENDLHVNDPIDAPELCDLLVKGLERTNPKMTSDIKMTKGIADEPLRRDQAAEILVAILGEKEPDNPWNFLYKEKIVGKDIYERLKENAILSKSEAYVLAANFLQYVEHVNK